MIESVEAKIESDLTIDEVMETTVATIQTDAKPKKATSAKSKTEVTAA